MVRLHLHDESHPKSPISLHIFSNITKPPSSSSSSSSSSCCSSCITTMKLMKTLVQNLIICHICRMGRAVSKAKTLLVDVFREKNRNKYRKKILFGSFRLHYNWCNSSSHVLPILSPNNNNNTTWNSAFSAQDCNLHCKLMEQEEQEEGLSSYLQWLEEEKCNKSGNLVNSNIIEGNVENEIDKLADMFIASCHEKFRLEKIESYRRYQEMLARSM